MALTAVARLLVVKNGKCLVNRLQLCPGLAATVAKPMKEQCACRTLLGGGCWANQLLGNYWANQ